MKKYQFILSMCMALAFLCTSTITSYAEDENDKERNDCEMNQEVMHRHAAIDTHINYYYELLIDKFMPELKEEWEEVSREKEVIMKKMKEMKKEGKEIDYSVLKDDWKEKHQKYHEEFLNAVKKREGVEIARILPSLVELQKQWNTEYREIVKES